MTRQTGFGRCAVTIFVILFASNLSSAAAASESREALGIEASSGRVAQNASSPERPRRRVVRIAKKRIIEAAHRLFKKGMDRYKAGKFDEAMMAFYRLAAKKDSIPPRLVELVEFWLAKTCYRTGLYSTSFSMFKKIVVNAKKANDQRKFLAALQWMIRIYSVSYNTTEFHGFLAEFGQAYSDPYFQKQSRVLFTLGVYYYDKGQLPEAVRYFKAISKRSALYLYALYYLGVVLERQNKPSHALRFFQEVERLLEKRGQERFANVLVLARLEIARLYYELNYFAESIDYFKKIPRGTDYWKRAHFEMAWAYFRYGNPGDSLGNLWSFRAPFLKNFYEPEIFCLEAIVLFSLCHFDEANVKIDEFFSTYDYYLKTIKTILTRPTAAEMFLNAFVGDKPGKLGGDTEIPLSLVESVLDNKDFLEQALYVRRLKDEKEIAKKLSPEFARTRLALSIERRVSEKIPEATIRSAQTARDHLGKLYKKTQYFRDMIEYMKFEAVSSEKTFLESQIREPLVEDRPKYQIIEGVELVDGSFNWWKFESEWWRDELGYYKAKVENQCYQMEEKVD